MNWTFFQIDSIQKVLSSYWIVRLWPFAVQCVVPFARLDRTKLQFQDRQSNQLERCIRKNRHQHVRQSGRLSHGHWLPLSQLRTSLWKWVHNQFISTKQIQFNSCIFPFRAARNPKYCWWFDRFLHIRMWMYFELCQLLWKLLLSSKIWMAHKGLWSAAPNSMGKIGP